MQEPASMVSGENSFGPADDPLVPEKSGRRGAIKFAYASGSQPIPGYTIKRGVGVGGFGDVYYATSDAGKEVALKRIQRNLDVELRGVRQCLNLKHPNLVSLFDIRYDDEGQAWVVMEYVAGESLQDVVERNPNGMPVDEALRWMRGIADGVGYLHDHGIVHRDLKPGNLFIDEGIVKIGDYGLSKFISCSRRSGQTESVGTFHYMAPEIGLGRYGKEIDVYAMGILLYEMLTGHVPYEGESSQEIIMKHLTAEPNLQGIRPPLRQVIARCLAKAPEQRFQSVREMMQHLQPHSGGPHVRVVEPEVPSAAPQREPLAHAVVSNLQSIHKWWMGQNRLTQVILAAALVIFLVLNSVWLFEIAVVGAMLYAGYFTVWYLCLCPPTRNSAPAAKPVVAQLVSADPPQRTASRTAARRSPRPSRQEILDALRDSLGQKSLLDRTAELTGSMLMAALVSVVLCVVMLVVGSPNLQGQHEWGPMYAWMAITSVVSSWSILTLSKFWESSAGDHALRRFCMLATGLLVGGFAYMLSSGLMLKPTYLLGSWDGIRDEFSALYFVDGLPTPLAYVGYFGGLFLILRWWLNADPLRATRLSIFSTVVVIVSAMGMHLVLPVPRGFLVAATTAIAVQLSAPWMNTRQRKEISQSLASRA